MGFFWNGCLFDGEKGWRDLMEQADEIDNVVKKRFSACPLKRNQGEIHQFTRQEATVVTRGCTRLCAWNSVARPENRGFCLITQKWARFHQCKAELILFYPGASGQEHNVVDAKISKLFKWNCSLQCWVRGPRRSISAAPATMCSVFQCVGRIPAQVCWPTNACGMVKMADSCLICMPVWQIDIKTL